MSAIARPTAALRHALALALLLGATPSLALAQTAAPAVKPPLGQPLASGTVMDAVAKLKPGEFIWAPAVAPDGPMLLFVSVATQRAVLYRNAVPIAVSTVSTGRKGYATPTGVFTILQKDIDHRSNLYDDAPMPYMQRLTWSGVALHAGNLPGYPASHGCIRLPHRFAELLYGVTALGMTVVITDQRDLPRLAPPPDMVSAIPVGSGDTPSPTPDALLWAPDRAPEGPVSIIVSTADQRVVVLRNGVEIGHAPVIAPDSAGTRTSAYTLQSIDPAGYHWLQVGLPGQTSAPDVSPGMFRQFIVAPGFRRAVAEIVVPGTTVVITPDSLRSGQAGESHMVIEAGPGAETP